MYKYRAWEDDSVGKRACHMCGRLYVGKTKKHIKPGYSSSSICNPVFLYEGGSRNKKIPRSSQASYPGMHTTRLYRDPHLKKDGG